MRRNLYLIREGVDVIFDHPSLVNEKNPVPTDSDMNFIIVFAMLGTTVFEKCFRLNTY